MRTIHIDEVQWQLFSSHRPGSARNKRLLAGEEGSPSNYELSIVEVDGSYATPRHHHNFDQFRFMLEGRFGVGPELVLEKGSLSYFPEGTHYIQQGIGRSQTLLLQFGGASGNGFMSYRQLERGQHDLAALGEFSGGRFHASNPSEGASSKDAYEAIWERINGRDIAYPRERIASPVVTDPDALDFVASADEPGVAVKSCGRFSERDIGMGFLRVEAGASHTLRKRRLYYLLDGDGICGETGWSAGQAIDVEDDIAHYVARDDSLFLYYDRPTFDPLPTAA